MKHDNDNRTGIRFLSVCSGIEAASVAWHPLGWRAVAFSEIEKFPSAVLAHHYPDVPNLGDFTKIDTTTLGRVDVLAGGTPCFTAGHMVLSARGYVPIEDIKVGDEVVTHKGRLRTVVRIGNERKEVGVLTGVGMCEPITCTPDHPFLSVEWRNQNTRRNNLYTKVEHCGQPEWVAAKEMPGRQWCQLLSHDNDNRAPESAKFDVKTAMYIAGMYLGDGWIRKHEGKAKKSVVLGINPKKYVKLKAAIGNAVHTVSHERTTVRVSIHDTAFADWLEAAFAHYSHLKTVPSWVMGHGFRGEFLRGFLDTDGSVAKDGKVSISTTSRSLAYGISDLMAAEGYVSSVALVETPDTCVIEGRTCSQRDYYQVRAYPQSVSRKSRVRHDMMLRTVSDFTPAGEATVFNIEVEEDHSYVVQSAIVHNCQAFSVAGLRGGLDDARGNLTLKFVELAHELAANNGLRNAVWENVVGVLSTKDNAFGCFLAGLVGADSALIPCEQPADGKSNRYWKWSRKEGRHVVSWPTHGMVAGPKGRAAWAVKDGQFFRVAQRRRRVLLVADFGAGADPSAVLFEPESVPRDTPPSREARKDVAPTISTRTKGGGGLGTDFDLDGGLIHAPEIARCVATREGSSQDYETTTMVAQNVAFDLVQITSKTNRSRAEDGLPAPTMSKASNMHIAQTVAIRGREGGATAELGGEVATALRASQGGGDKPHVLTSAVRRLTPVECERLQGFPDHYTRIPWRGKPADQCPDGPRYKALGNSWAVPKFVWLGKRLHRLLATNDNTPSSEAA